MKANTPSSGTKRVLVVDDDLETGELMRVWLRTCGHEPIIAASVPDALEQIALGGFTLYILDSWLGHKGGLDLCKHIRASDRRTPVVLFGRGL